MRILMFDNEFPPLGGGMGTANLELFRIFEKNPALEIDLVTSALGGRFEETEFSKNIRIYKVPVMNRNIHHSSNRELITYTILAMLVGLRLVLANHYDLLFAWSTVPAGAVAWLIGKIFSIRYLVWVSGPDIPGFEQRYSKIYPLLLPLLKLVWRNAHTVIAKCNEEVDLIRKYLPGLAIKLIPNGVNIEQFKPISKQLDGAPLNLLCSARLIKRKGQHHIIEAVRKLKDEGVIVNLTLLGTGDAQDEYMLLANQLGIIEQIHFLGYIPREEISKFYQNSDLFVLPSFWEGLSLAALEAMASGLPLLVTKTGGSFDLVDEGRNGFIFEWGDVDALARLIRKFHEDKNLVNEMGRVSAERAALFSWRGISEQYRRMFELAIA